MVLTKQQVKRLFDSSNRLYQSPDHTVVSDGRLVMPFNLLAPNSLGGKPILASTALIQYTKELPASEYTRFQATPLSIQGSILYVSSDFDLVAINQEYVSVLAINSVRRYSKDPLSILVSDSDGALIYGVMPCKIDFRSKVMEPILTAIFIATRGGV